MDCGSKKHWIDVCPHVEDPQTALMINEFAELNDEQNQENVTESANIVLMIDKVDDLEMDKHEILVSNQNSAVQSDVC